MLFQTDKEKIIQEHKNQNKTNLVQENQTNLKKQKTASQTTSPGNSMKRKSTTVPSQNTIQHHFPLSTSTLTETSIPDK